MTTNLHSVLLARWRAFAVEIGGNVAIATATTLPVLVGFAGLGVETGYWYFEQRRMQAAADVAAYAGTVVARAGGTGNAIVQAATTEAGISGFKSAAGSIVVNWPPTTGDHMNARAVEVLIRQDYERIFLTRFAGDSVTVSVRAVSAFEQPMAACLLALDELAGEALRLTGSARAHFTGCTLMSNSLADDAASIEGSADLTAPCVNSSGGISDRAGVTLTECPAPRSHMPRAEDPYADLPAPDTSGSCSSVPGGNGATTLSPGKYCGGMALKGDVTLEPGVYVVSGGTLRINANSNVSGAGVTFYLTDGAGVHMNGAADIALSAPTSGTYRDVLFFGGDNALGGDVLFNGSAGSTLDGAVYFPQQAVEMRGSFGGSGGCTRIVAQSIEISGSADFVSDCTGAGHGGATAPGAVHLVE